MNPTIGLWPSPGLGILCPLTPYIDLDPDPYSVDEVEDSSADDVEFP